LTYIVPTSELVKSNFRTCIITFYAVAIALLFGQSQYQQRSSLHQLQIVLSLIILLFIATVCELRLSNFGKLFYYLAVAGEFITIVVIIAVTYTRTQGVPYSGCALDNQSLGGVPFIVALTLGCLILLLVGPYLCAIASERYQPTVLVVFWTADLVAAIVFAETQIKSNILIHPDGSSEALPEADWGLGQVIAVIMLAGQLMEIGSNFHEHYQEILDRYFVPVNVRVRRLFSRADVNNHQVAEDAGLLEAGQDRRDEVLGMEPMARANEAETESVRSTTDTGERNSNRVEVTGENMPATQELINEGRLQSSSTSEAVSEVVAAEASTHLEPGSMVRHSRTW
jgi:hypothetical protein